MNPHQRLIEWAVHGQLGDAGMPIPRRALTSRRLEVLDGVEVPGDGGFGELIDRLGYLAERQQRVREIHSAILAMPDDFAKLVVVTYRLPPREIPRQAAEAMRMLAMSERTYFRRKSEMLTWLRGRITPVCAAA